MAQSDLKGGADPWAEARALVDGGAEFLNIGYEAVDRHVAHGHGDTLAMRWLGKDGARRDLSYVDMAALSSRFANVLKAHGLAPGDPVSVFPVHAVGQIGHGVEEDAGHSEGQLHACV